MLDDDDRHHMATRGRSRKFTLRAYLWAVKTRPERLAGVARWRLRGLTFREIALKYFDQGAIGSFEKRHRDLQALISRVRYTWMIWSKMPPEWQDRILKRETGQNAGRETGMAGADETAGNDPGLCGRHDSGSVSGDCVPGIRAEDFAGNGPGDA